MPVLNALAEIHPELTAIRRDIHMHPELGFEEHRTAAIVADALRKMGCDEVVEGVGRTGVVGVIKGRSTASGRVIGLRADMDALPILEATGAEHASQTPGKMHACGHDGHTTILIGAARILADTRRFDGTVVLFFQPAEEGGGGGREMVQEGVMERWGVQRVFGLHNMPGVEEGVIAMRPGPIMAAADHFEIHIEGLGGHAARPHACTDPNVIAAQIVLAAQTLVARRVDPVESAVVTIASIHSDVDIHNVIPQTVEMKGTIRTLNEAVRDELESRLNVLVSGIAAANGATAKLDYHRNYPVTVNDPAQTEFAAEVARDVVGPDKVVTDGPPLLGAEDFSFMLNARPGAYVFLGAGEGPGVHHPKYDFNDEIIPTGATYFVRLAEIGMPLG